MSSHVTCNRYSGIQRATRLSLVHAWPNNPAGDNCQNDLPVSEQIGEANYLHNDLLIT
ncbi:hypothetical protein SK128_020758, partial [Halocaridina rubra]